MFNKCEEYAPVLIYDPEGQEETELRDDELDDGEETEEIEVEVTDDEDDGTGPVTPLRSPAPPQKDSKGKKPAYVASTPSSSGNKQPVSTEKPEDPKKIAPSDEVKNIDMASPQNPKARTGAIFSPDRNPFPAFGS